MKKQIVLSLIILVGFLSSTITCATESPGILLERYKNELRDTTINLLDSHLWREAAKVSMPVQRSLEDSPKTKTLGGYLKSANVLRCNDATLIHELVLHIGFSPYAMLGLNNSPRDETTPVYSVLNHLGVRAVNPLIRTMKEIYPDTEVGSNMNSFSDTSYSSFMVRSCLAEIYEQGKQGEQMMKERLNLELGRSKSDKEKSYIEQSIQRINEWNEMKSNGKVMIIPYSSVQKLLVHQDEMKMIISNLSDPAIWKDANYVKDKVKTENLLTWLKLAYTLRCDGVESILINHLMYSPFEGQDVKKDMSLETKYPVYDTLCRIGITSVIPLINMLKNSDLDEATRNLIIQGLVNIYEQGGFGKEMTRYRLQLESGSSIGKDKDLLDKTLQNPLLK